MKSSADTAMIVSSCELPENVLSIPIPNNELCDCDPPGVLEWFAGCGLAGHTQQRAAWEFPRVTPRCTRSIASDGLE